MSTSWRIFCAVELPAELRAQLLDHILQLRRQVPEAAASWSRAESIHLTLKFFGNVAGDRLPVISSAASRAVKEFASFHISVGGAGVFPKPARPQVLWIGINDPTNNLLALQQRFEDECEEAGFEREGRTFRPHLTLARLRKPEGAKQLADAHLHSQFKSTEVKLTELIVFRSELSSQGSTYTAISRHQLLQSGQN